VPSSSGPVLVWCWRCVGVALALRWPGDGETPVLRWCCAGAACLAAAVKVEEDGICLSNPGEDRAELRRDVWEDAGLASTVGVTPLIAPKHSPAALLDAERSKLHS